ncbi:hypothetical protein BD324DRAFT_649308 [Kockovaella imperatae]|uniref:Transmembrane protein n=1 Tax=Kockovaella imperatae TaxID=4999 RepID=A0A1Y1UNY9_9TREE|nr:hypothetical protein BD324DRAFT_649308 [Kockovaella imperatae]ORX39224.1 hypothetical protein BD324DRAFT_649308 [Kockovaella imperatae]
MVFITGTNSIRRREDQAPEGSGEDSYFVSDSSPIFSYANGTSSSSWTAGYAMQSDGYDETLHLTTISQSTIMFNMTASSMTFLIPSFYNCQATVSINDSATVPACTKSSDTGDEPFTLFNLPLGVHNVKYDTGHIEPGQRVIFWGIDGIRPPDTAQMTNVTVDDTYSSADAGPVGITWQGAWNHIDSESDTSLEEQNGLGSDFNKTISVTSKTGASVTFSGAGSAFYIYGLVGPGYGSASVALDNEMVMPSLNLTAPWPMPYQLLWFTTGLNPNQTHTVTMTSLSEQKMAIDFFLLSADPVTLSRISTTAPGSTEFISTTAGKLICFLLAPLIMLVAVALVLWWFFVRRRDRQDSVRGSDSSSQSGIWLHPSPSNEKPPAIMEFDKNWSNPSIEMFVSYEHGHTGYFRTPSKASSATSGRSGRSHRSQKSTSSGRSYRSHRTTTSHHTQQSTDSSEWRRVPSGTSASTNTSTSTSSDSSQSHRSRSDRESTTDDSPMTPAHRAPPAVLLANVQAQAAALKDDRPEGWQRPLRSLLGSSYARSDTGDMKRQTNLPPYSAGLGTIEQGSEGRIQFTGAATLLPTASDEKMEHFRRMLAVADGSSNTSNRSPPAHVQIHGPSTVHASVQPSSCALTDDARFSMAPWSGIDRMSSLPPSEVMSVYGQPPSERRESNMTSFTMQLDPGIRTPLALRPSMSRPTPRVITDLSDSRADRRRDQGEPPSSLSSGAANSAVPLLSRHDRLCDVPGTLYDVNLEHDLDLQLAVSEERHQAAAQGPSSWRGGGRNRSGTIASSRSGTSIGTTMSGARPDSGLIPFEEFYSSVRPR